VPGFALFAPEEFISGLVRGYFDGDGNINAPRHMIRVHSISKDLLEGIALLLARFGIFGTFGIGKKTRANPLHNYILLRKYARKFMERIGSDFPDKKKALGEIIKYNEREEVKSRREDIDRIPMVGEEIARVAKPLKLPGYSRNYKRWIKKESIGRETLRKYLQVFQDRASELGIQTDLNLIRQAVDSDIVWDSIISIEMLPDPNESVYDFGVKGNHTFMVANGLFVHNTLNVFHSTGEKDMDVSLGVPRLKEILNVTEHPKNPSCTAHFLDPSLEEGAKVLKKLEESLVKEVGKSRAKTRPGAKRSISSREKMLSVLMKQNKTKYLRHLKNMKKTFEETRVGSLVLEYEMKYVEGDVNPLTDASPANIIPYRKYQEPWWKELSRKLHNSGSLEPRNWVIDFKINVEEMCRRAFTIEEIIDAIEKEGDGCLSCSGSPNNVGELEIVADYDKIEDYLRSKGFLNSDKSLKFEGLPRRITNSNLKFFLCRDSLIPHLKNLKLSGLSKIEKVYPYESPNTHELVLRSRGSNFKAILATLGVDSVKTSTNHVWEIYRTLGIEAVRKFLIEEITRVLSFGGTYINPRHIQLLVDSMTDGGDITSVNRTGISRKEGPVKKIMFEQPVDNTVEAAAFTEMDDLLSVASSIMYGKLARSGTGMVNVQPKGRVSVRPPKLPRTKGR